MSATAPPPWWHASLATADFEAEPLVEPWLVADAWTELVAAFADPELFELACGMGRQPSPEALERAMRSPPDVRLWRLTAPGEGHLGALLVHSRYTTVDRVYVWAPTGTEVSESTWGAALARLADEVFAREPLAEYVTCHLPKPAHPWQEAALVGHGFDPYSVDDDYKPPPREVWGMAREDRAARDDRRAPG